MLHAGSLRQFRGGSVNCSGATYKGPLHEYSHNTGCESITGGAFVPDGFWPASYDDAYLFGDYVCGKIFKLTPKDGGGFGRTEFAAGLGKGGPIAMTFGPYRTTGKALYYTTFVNGGEVRRISYTDGNHFHPLASGTGNQLTFTGPRPEGLYSTDPMQNYLEIRLTATDSQGLSKTVSEELRPTTVDVTFETRPASLRLKVNGEAFTAPRTFVSWEGYRLNVLAPRQEDSDGRLWGFRSWSDGRPAQHTIRTPADAVTYTATFRRVQR